MKRKPHWQETLEDGEADPMQRIVKIAADEDLDMPVICAIQIAADSAMKWNAKNNPGHINEHGLQGIVNLENKRAWYSLFAHFGAPVYKFAREFGETLADAPINLSAKYIPFDNRLICIEFPDSIRFDQQGGFFAHCAYVVAADFRKWDVGLRPRASFRYRESGPPKIVERGINLLVPLYSADGVLSNTLDEANLNFFSDDETLEEALARGKINSAFPDTFGTELIKYVLKCLLYINSGDPDLREFRPSARPAGDNPKKYKKWAKRNLSTVPMTLVGFDFKKPKLYSKDSTRVRLHMRWQPYGPQLSKVKLIWIDEHTRQLNKPMIEESATSGETND